MWQRRRLYRRYVRRWWQVCHLFFRSQRKGSKALNGIDNDWRPSRRSFAHSVSLSATSLSEDLKALFLRSFALGVQLVKPVVAIAIGSDKPNISFR